MCYGAATTGDTITPGVAQRLRGAVDGSNHPDSTAMIYDGDEHGYPMFAVHLELQPALITWLQDQLLEQ